MQPESDHPGSERDGVQTENEFRARPTIPPPPSICAYAAYVPEIGRSDSRFHVAADAVDRPRANASSPGVRGSGT